MTAAAQAFFFGSSIAGVSSVRFDIEAVQSSTTFTGLAEVAFSSVSTSAAAPEPATLALLATGLLPIVGAVVRNRRKK